jgi:hypothetical protein
LNIGSHIHFSDFISPKAENFEQINTVFLITPAVSPIYMNNPGFTILDISNDNKISDVHHTYFQLWKYIAFKQITYSTINFIESYGIDMNDPQSIRDFI